MRYALDPKQSSAQALEKGDRFTATHPTQATQSANLSASGRMPYAAGEVVDKMSLTSDRLRGEEVMRGWLEHALAIARLLNGIWEVLQNQTSRHVGVSVLDLHQAMTQTATNIDYCNCLGVMVRFRQDSFGERIEFEPAGTAVSTTFHEEIAVFEGVRPTGIHDVIIGREFCTVSVLAGALKCRGGAIVALLQGFGQLLEDRTNEVKQELEARFERWDHTALCERRCSPTMLVNLRQQTNGRKGPQETRCDHVSGGIQDPSLLAVTVGPDIWTYASITSRMGGGEQVSDVSG